MNSGQHRFWVGVSHCTPDRRGVVGYGGPRLSLKLITTVIVTLNILIIIISLISEWMGLEGANFFTGDWRATSVAPSEGASLSGRLPRTHQRAPGVRLIALVLAVKGMSVWGPERSLMIW